jgi:hypothetical protein
MIHRIAQVVLALFFAVFLQPAAAQDFRNQFATQTALSLAMLTRWSLCAELGRIAGSAAEKKSAGMSLAELQSRLAKAAENPEVPDFSRQLVTLVAVDVFIRPGLPGPEISEEVSHACAAQLSEQLAIKLAEDMPDSEREVLKFVMSENYVPLGSAEQSRK